NEYCKAFAAGLHLADSPYAMVRIAWHSKPKLQEGRLFFSRRGRASEVTNHFLNQLIAEHSGFGTDVIATGNAGEHALTLDLGLRRRLPPRERVYPPVGSLALDQLLDVLASEARTFRQIERCLPEGVRTDPPIRRPDVGLGMGGRM